MGGGIAPARGYSPSAGALRRADPCPPPLPAQALLLLWFVVEDHDTLFILSESVHFLGIGVLGYKLLTKRNCSGAERAGWVQRDGRGAATCRAAGCGEAVWGWSGQPGWRRR